MTERKQGTWSSRSFAEIAGVVAVICLAGTRLAYDQFYRALGTTVDEVGLSNWRMVTASAAGLMSMATGAWTAVFAGVAAGRLIRQRVAAVLWTGMTTLATFVVLLILQERFAPAVWLPLSVATGVTLLLVSMAHVPWIERRPQFRLTFRGFLALTAASTILAWSFAWAQAGPSARALRQDGSRREGASVLLDLEIRPVCVTALAADNLLADLAERRPLLHLGTGSQYVILRDTRAKRTLKFPAASVALSITDRC